MKCVISGYGYVGRATKLVALQNNIKLTDIDINDPYQSMSATNWQHAKYHYVCTPTPLSNSNLHDVSSVIDALSVANAAGFSGITVIRSTMSPLDYDMLNTADNTIVWPEFLRKSSWNTDALNPLMSIVGGNDVSEFMLDHCKLPMQHIGDARTACMAKLAINSYLAARTVILHDIRKTCDALQINWNGVKTTLDSDPRLGKGYWEQPGPDGEYGFGGGCLPKDTAAMSTLISNNGITDSYATWAIAKNTKIRK